MHSWGSGIGGAWSLRVSERRLNGGQIPQSMTSAIASRATLWSFGRRARLAWLALLHF